MKAYFEQLTYYQPEMLRAIGETGYMLLIAVLVAVLIGLPLGTFIFLTRRNGVLESPGWSFVLNNYVNVVRSFHFYYLSSHSSQSHVG